MRSKNKILAEKIHLLAEIVEIEEINEQYFILKYKPLRLEDKILYMRIKVRGRNQGWSSNTLGVEVNVVTETCGISRYEAKFRVVTEVYYEKQIRRVFGRNAWEQKLARAVLKGEFKIETDLISSLIKAADRQLSKASEEDPFEDFDKRLNSEHNVHALKVVK